jgi:hypothetical protein
MSQHKYIPKFNNWVKINENIEENEIEERATALTRDFEEAIGKGNLQTSSLMIWFNGMMDLYDNTSFKGMVFNKMKPVWAKHFRIIYPILNMDNKELTKSDIMQIKRYKQISNSEVTNQRGADDLLKELGLL